jgi:hypothetical protein
MLFRRVGHRTGRRIQSALKKIMRLWISDGLVNSREAEKGVSCARFGNTISPQQWFCIVSSFNWQIFKALV